MANIPYKYENTLLFLVFIFSDFWLLLINFRFLVSVFTDYMNTIKTYNLPVHDIMMIVAFLTASCSHFLQDKTLLKVVYLQILVNKRHRMKQVHVHYFYFPCIPFGLTNVLITITKYLGVYFLVFQCRLSFSRVCLILFITFLFNLVLALFDMQFLTRDVMDKITE